MGYTNRDILIEAPWEVFCQKDLPASNLFIVKSYLSTIKSGNFPMVKSNQSMSIKKS